jgi:carbon-monoxide dehydrogenase medium subunit
MATSILTPKTLSDLVKVVAKHGKKAMLVSGIDPAADRIPAGKVMVDVAGIEALNEVSDQKDRVIIGTGLNLGRVVREAIGENGLLRQAASLIANPLVRNRITLAEALDPDSPYFDITTALALLDSKVRIQGTTGRRTLPIPEFLELATTGLKKGEMPVAVEFAKLRSNERVGFFRLARMGGKGTVSAAARMRLVRNVPTDPEIVVSSMSLIPLRSKAAEKEIAGKPAAEETIKRAAAMAAEEIGSIGGKPNSYEQTLIEITVARTLRGIMEGSLTA